MHTITAINANLAEADSDLVCQPGVRWADINAILKERGNIMLSYVEQIDQFLIAVAHDLRYSVVLSRELQ